MMLHDLDGINRVTTTFQLVVFLRLGHSVPLISAQFPTDMNSNENSVMQVAVRNPFHVKVIGTSRDELKSILTKEMASTMQQMVAQLVNLTPRLL